MENIQRKFFETEPPPSSFSNRFLHSLALGAHAVEGHRHTHTISLFPSMHVPLYICNNQWLPKNSCFLTADKLTNEWFFRDISDLNDHIEAEKKCFTSVTFGSFVMETWSMDLWKENFLFLTAAAAKFPRVFEEKYPWLKWPVTTPACHNWPILPHLWGLLRESSVHWRLHHSLLSLEDFFKMENMLGKHPWFDQF